MYSDKDMKKYEPQKAPSKKGRTGIKQEYSEEFAEELSEGNRDIRENQESFLYNGNVNMLDTSELLDFSEGTDSY